MVEEKIHSYNEVQEVINEFREVGMSLHNAKKIFDKVKGENRTINLQLDNLSREAEDINKNIERYMSSSTFQERYDNGQGMVSADLFDMQRRFIDIMHQFIDWLTLSRTIYRLIFDKVVGLIDETSVLEIESQAMKRMDELVERNNEVTRNWIKGQNDLLQGIILNKFEHFDNQFRDTVISMNREMTKEREKALQALASAIDRSIDDREKDRELRREENKLREEELKRKSSIIKEESPKEIIKKQDIHQEDNSEEDQEEEKDDFFREEETDKDTDQSQTIAKEGMEALIKEIKKFAGPSGVTQVNDYQDMHGNSKRPISKNKKLIKQMPNLLYQMQYGQNDNSHLLMRYEREKHFEISKEIDSEDFDREMKILGSTFERFSEKEFAYELTLRTFFASPYKYLKKKLPDFGSEPMTEKDRLWMYLFSLEEGAYNDGDMWFVIHDDAIYEVDDEKIKKASFFSKFQKIPVFTNARIYDHFAIMMDIANGVKKRNISGKDLKAKGMFMLADFNLIMDIAKKRDKESKTPMW